jgi:hypothetical protein
MKDAESKEQVNFKAVNDNSLRSAIKFGVVVQLALFLITALNLDGGVLFRQCMTALMAYWLGLVIVLHRRRSTPTKTDMIYLRIGPMALTFLAPFVAMLVYRIIGQSTESGLSRLLHI